MSGRSRRSDNSSSASSAVEVVEVDKESEPAGTLLTVDENLPENKHKIYKASKSLDVLVDELIKIPELKDKDGEKYAVNVSADAQVLLLKKVTRLFLTKGAKKENIKRDVISKLIKEEMGAENTKYLNAVMTRVQMQLKEIFGYDVTSRDFMANQQTLGAKKSNQKATGSEYILFNRLKSPVLQDILIDKSGNKAWMGFVFVVLHLINMSPAKEIEERALLDQLRSLDERFPANLDSGDSGANAIPELGESFKNLVKRMVSERYIVENKDMSGGNFGTQASQGSGIVKSYKFGPRYFVELGGQQLIKSYFDTMDQPVDQNLLKDAKEELDDMVQEDDDEEEEEEEVAVKEKEKEKEKEKKKEKKNKGEKRASQSQQDKGHTRKKR